MALGITIWSLAALMGLTFMGVVIWGLVSLINYVNQGGM